MASLLQAYSWEYDQCTNNHNNLGYSLNYRNQQTIDGITYYDCSSFQWYGLLNGGFDVEAAYLVARGEPYSGNAITTPYMPAWLAALGWYEADINGMWLAGDIVWRGVGYLGHPYGHCEMVAHGGSASGITMGAHSDEDDGYPPGQQVTVNDFTSYAASYQKLFRFGTTPPEPPEPPEPGKHKMPVWMYTGRIYRRKTWL